MFRNATDRLKETHLATRLDRWMTGIIVLLIFALGFIAGRWTSLTSHATPIVFQEAPGGSSATSAEHLRALASERPTSTPRTRGSSSDRTAQTSAPPPPPAPAAEPPPAARAPAVAGAFVASANGAKYYAPDCPEVRRIKEENKIWFDTESEARDAGYEESACLQKRRK